MAISKCQSGCDVIYQLVTRYQSAISFSEKLVICNQLSNDVTFVLED